MQDAIANDVCPSMKQVLKWNRTDISVLKGRTELIRV